VSASGWLAIGTVLAALVTPGVGSPIVAVVAASLALAAATISRAEAGAVGRARRRGRPAMAVAIGALAIGLRLMTSPIDTGTIPADELPDGRGPWTAVVESRGSDREGQQVATLRITGGADGDRPGSWLVADKLVSVLEKKTRPAKSG